jgi:hypothetical protein
MNLLDATREHSETKRRNPVNRVNAVMTGSKPTSNGPMRPTHVREDKGKGN